MAKDLWDIGGRIYLIRGQRVMLDEDLAEIYGVTTKRLNQQAGRNQGRFPSDFRLQFNAKEARALRLQSATSKNSRGGRRYRPYAFTEHGAVMLASVLNTSVAVRASVQIARTLWRWVAHALEIVPKLPAAARRDTGPYRTPYQPDTGRRRSLRKCRLRSLM